MRRCTVRKLLIGLLALALLLLGAALPLVMPRRCPVTREAAARIKDGMTRADVEAILGGPPGDYRTTPPGEWDLSVTIRFGPPGRPSWAAERWYGDEGDAVVYFDSFPSGGVIGAEFAEAIPHTTGPLTLALWRLQRLKQHWLR
jgi:hypothetical protein